MQVGDGVPLPRRLLRAVASIKVRANRRMAGISCQLADVVDMLDNFGQAHLAGGTFAPHPAWRDLPAIKGDGDDAITLNENFYLLIGKAPPDRVERSGAAVGKGQRPRL